VYDGDYGYDLLTKHFETHSLKGFGVEDLEIAHVAAGALMHYMQETQKAYLRHLRRLYAYESNEFMSLDAATKRNLELTTSIQEGGTEGTLISILDDTCTAMGGRLLRRWIMRPLKRLKPIQQRLDAVETLYENNEIRNTLREELEQIGDMERLISRICMGRTNARDVVQLKLSLAQIPRLKSQIASIDDPLLQDISGRLKLLIEVQERINTALKDDPPASVRDGGMIEEGFNDELDELRDIAKNGKKYIAQIKDELAKEHNISSLKIGYNKVFGYMLLILLMTFSRSLKPWRNWIACRDLQKWHSETIIRNRKSVITKRSILKKAGIPWLRNPCLWVNRSSRMISNLIRIMSRSSSSPGRIWPVKVSFCARPV